MKVLICSNGPWPDGDHRTAWAFDELVVRGEVAEYRMLSHGREDPQQRPVFLCALKDQLEQFRPDLVIWHKDDGTDLDEAFVQSIARQTRLVYHDMDPWYPIIKPSQRNQHILARHAHRVYLVGLGPNARQFPQAETRVRYLPHGYCDIDLPQMGPDRRKNLVFIANVPRRFKKLLGPLAPEQHPGRTKYVGVLRRRLGERFIVHGNGYPKAWGIKPCAFDDQFRLATENLATFANDASPGSVGYFSNRTPFSLACGSLHIKIRRPLDDLYFQDCPGIILVKDAEEAADAFDLICSMSNAEITDISARTKEFARNRFRMPDLYSRLIQD